MIIIPEKISIAGITYTTVWVKELEGGLVAQIHFRNGTIELLDNMSNDVTFASFMHEVQHGIFSAQAINIGEQIYHDDMFVERVSQLWSQVFKQLIDYNYDSIYDDGLLAPEEVESEEDVLTIDVDGFD